MASGQPTAKKPRAQTRPHQPRPQRARAPADVRIDFRPPAAASSANRLAPSASRRRGARAGAKEGAFPVRTEFVFMDGRPHEDVKLCGDWNKWEAVQLEVEQEGIWSVITTVPCGYREFVYVVDGDYTLSPRHPTTAEGTCNWRTVHGPPSPASATQDADRRGAHDARNRLLRFADAAADHLRSLILYCVERGRRLREGGGRRCGAGGLPEVESDTYAQGSTSARMLKKTMRGGGTVRLLAFVCFLSGCYFLTATRRR